MLRIDTKKPIQPTPQPQPQSTPIIDYKPKSIYELDSQILNEKLKMLGINTSKKEKEQIITYPYKIYTGKVDFSIKPAETKQESKTVDLKEYNSLFIE